MNKLFILSFFLFGFISILYSQTPQIALVKPDGTTTIHTNMQAAYDAAADGDYLYLSGGLYTFPPIDKKLFIYGAGSIADSCSITGISRCTNPCHVFDGAAWGSIEGIYFNTDFTLDNTNNFIISNCFIQGQIATQNPVSNITIKNNYLGTYAGYSILGLSSFSTFLISNNIITGHILNGSDILIKNNIFFQGNVNIPSNSTFENNIFIAGTSGNSNSLFNNNVNITIGIEPWNNTYNNNFDEAWTDIFVNPGINPYSYDVHNDYHVKATSLCHNSGTDGNDRGIYGGMYPFSEGFVPSNPHIYFKQVSEQTDANGLLQIHFKVRTNN